MEDPGHHAFPDVPEDVARLIFEVATEVGDSNCRLAYPLISKRVQGWVEPIIYREVEASGLFHRTVMAPISSKPLDFFARHVKSLMFEMQEDRVVADILERCTAVQSLAIWYNANPHAANTRHALTSYPLSPTHLSLSQFLFGDEDAFTYTIFDNVTHLDISCPNSEDDWGWSSLGVLEHLTHLSIDIYTKPDDPIHLAKIILSSCRPTLRVLILCICFSPDGPSVRMEAFKALAGGDIDSRVVVAPYSVAWTELDQRFSMTLVYADLFRSWAIPSHGNTLWTRAEQIVRERRRRTADSELASKLSHLTVEEYQCDDQREVRKAEVVVQAAEGTHQD